MAGSDWAAGVLGLGGSSLAALYDPVAGDGFAAAHRFELLASFIPARTLPVGANRVQVIDWSGQNRNFDMQAAFQKHGWPAERKNAEWHHSDLCHVAYVYVQNLYDKMVQVGGLKQ